MFPELVEDRLVEQELDVLGIVECFGGGAALVGPFLVARLARVDALDDAEAAKVGKRDLQLLESLVSGDIVGRCSFRALLKEGLKGVGV